jgi:hypothetical protein
MRTVYVETTIPSYLAAKPSRDLVVSAHQQITAEWWERARQVFDLRVSSLVIEELAEGDPAVALRRLEAVRGLPVLAISPRVVHLAAEYDTRLNLGGDTRNDLTHLAFAVVYEADYLITWNCRHLANATLVRRISDLNRDLGEFMPMIVTPEELPPEDEGVSL